MEVNDGFLILNKSKNCTSHDCVKRIKRIFNIKKVGHTGTLDPQVTGVLPLALGSATRFIQYLPQEKSYTGIIQLGIKTTTDDIHGEIMKQKDVPKLKVKLSVLSVDFFVIGCVREKLKGPIGVKRSKAIPVALLKTFESSIELS